MVNLQSVQASNAALRSTISGQVALFVGATSGIAYHTLLEYAKNSSKPRVYVVGRNDTTLSKITAELEALNPEGTFFAIKSEVSLLKNVDAACEELKSKEKRLDLLLMCPGYVKINPIYNTDGLEETISLHYYVRARFIQNLLPLLSAPPTSRIVSIHGAGNEGKLNENDLELAHSFSVRAAAMHTATMNTLALAEIAATHPSISCLHVFPGIVMTKATEHIVAKDWVLPLRLLWAYVVLPIAKFFAVTLSESGQRHLFHATSARYKPTAKPGAGVPLQPGMTVAIGEDGREGTGCYILNYDGEPIGNQNLFDEYRKKEMGKKIWQHTDEVFDRVLGVSGKP
ncbi:MAG: hypothetical protein Q9195_008527 [Heterodermia aff. obscurata]